jgi:23S rRNA pseudouridine1911/1915/1917 synthase
LVGEGRIRLCVSREASGGRLDRFLAEALAAGGGTSRSELQRWIAEGRVTVAGLARSASARLREGDWVVVDPPPPPTTEAAPDPGVRFEILHVDDAIVVIDKPAGLVVHPARGHPGGTLVNGLLAMGLFSREALDAFDSGDRAAPVSGAHGAPAYARPGIVHRIDKGTSGVMVVARTPPAHRALSEQFRAHSIERVYEALAVGEARGQTFDTTHGRHPGDRLRFTSRASVTRPTTPRRAVTHVRVVARLAGVTHVECRLETGRTHQIRMHLAESGTPVLGDPLYGSAPRDERVRAVAERLGHQALHARVLGFEHPDGLRRLRFEAPIPEDFRDALRALERSGGPPE